jgi:adenylyltransferase/sulfurtransferase
MLTDNEKERYARQLGIPGWGDDVQLKLKDSSVFVAGAGGIGAPVLFYLTAAGVGSITICDCDTVNLSNLNRQLLHPENRQGMLKTESAQETLCSMNSNIKLIIKNERITMENAAEIIESPDLIIDCLDNFKTRQAINAVSVKKSIPLLHGGVAEFRGQVTLIHPPETACLACFLPDKDTGGVTYICGASAGLIGSIQAVEAIKYLTGIGVPLLNKILFWDGIQQVYDTVNISKNKNCSVCAKAV